MARKATRRGRRRRLGNEAYLLSVALSTSFFASFFMWRASFFALRLFRFAWRLVLSAPLSVCSVSLTLSVAFAVVSFTSFIVSLSANTGSARPMASAAMIPFLIQFPLASAGRMADGPPGNCARAVRWTTEEHARIGLPFLRLVARRLARVGRSLRVRRLLRIGRLLRVGRLPRYVAGPRRHAGIAVRALRVVRRARVGRPRDAACAALIGGAGAAARIRRGPAAALRACRAVRSRGAGRARLRVIGFRRVGRRGAVPAAGAARRAPPLRAAVLLDLLFLARDGLVGAAGGGSAALHLAGALVADAGGDGRSTAARDGTRRVVAGRTVAARRAALPGLRRLLAGVRGRRGRRGVGRGVVARQRAVGRRGV